MGKVENEEKVRAFLHSFTKSKIIELYLQLMFYKNVVEQELEADRDTWKRACELACEETPLHCPSPPEYYNAQYEYGSDEPYWIEEGGCEFDDPVKCIECQINYFYKKAKEAEIKFNENRNPTKSAQ